MFRCKKDVDRHVQDIFRKLKNEEEKNLRCYNIAKLYYQVGDYESAKRYVSSYLEVREGSAGAHKLLGQALEALGQKESALSQYKISLELEGRQNDLVLKVCELLADTDVGIDTNGARYWIERADKLYPHHPVVFQLKEKMLSIDRPNNNSEDLEGLIASELSARPKDIHLRVKLLKHYMAKNKFEDAYNHALSVEATYSHRNTIVWYQALCELLPKCKESKQSDVSFWILYISALERYAALSLKEQGAEVLKTVPEAAQAVFNFDQSLNELKLKNFTNNATVIEHMLSHMWGQLHFHLACLFLRKTKREQGSWSEAGRLCAPLFLSALHVVAIDPTASWAVKLKDGLKDQIRLWYTEGSYRCSQAGHVLQDYAKDDVKKLMDRIDKFCIGSWRNRVYQRIFVSKNHQKLIGSSYFCNHAAPSIILRLCSYMELKRYDEISEEVWPDSLHHQVWLGIKSRPYSKDGGPHPHQYSHVFPELQFSVYNLNQAAPDSLNRLDIDAFLNATILCSSVVVEEQQLSGFLNPERLPTLPADLTNTLCTCAQEKWWSCAYKMYSKQELLDRDIAEIRQELQRGLEVIRCIGNHGLHPAILIHLGRIFHHRVKLLKEKDKAHSDIPALEARSELYWTNAVSLLERLQNNQNIRMANSKLFNYQGKDLNNAEITNALEEGKLLLAQQFLRDKQYEQAIDALQALKCPEASFQQGLIYKALADEKISSQPRESLTSEMRSQHIIMLSKARNCFYLTLDRLRSPGTDPKHPLNSELCTHISDIENELKRIDPDLWRSDLNRNECDGMSDESYSSAHSGVDHPVTVTNMTSSVNVLSTPQRNSHRTPKQSSTPCRPQNLDVLDLSRNRSEVRPSPERLDAQIRQLIHSRDNVMQTIIEQNKTIMDTNKTLMEKMDQLTKEMAELRKDSQKQVSQRVVSSHPPTEEEVYGLGTEEYGDVSYASNQSAARSTSISTISGNMQFPAANRHPYSPLVYPPTAFQGYYQGGMPFSDPNAQAIPPLFPYSIPLYYPDRPKMPENVLQQGIFAPKLPGQLPDLTTQPPSQPLQMMPQKIDTARPETTIKDAPVNKAPPVNVVITISDTLPTTVPQVQTTLSVTIPPQHRLGTVATSSIGETTNVPHSYQISMPSEATIPTTVNLPPLSATLTTTPASISLIETSQANKTNILSKTSPNTSAEVCEVEHDPIPDFVPVIPLPAEVKVTTGEEGENVLYCARAKLFRFVDKEWKERGVGDVKLLQNTEGKVRLLMRRDQVLKICANHMLRPDMELTPMPNNDRAWIWVANDFADERVRLEKLCIKFKTADEARSFRENFDRAKFSYTPSAESSLEVIDKSSSSQETPKTPTTPTIGDMSKSDVQKDGAQTPESISLGKQKSATTPVVIGGFSFISNPIIQKDTSDVSKTTQKSEEAPKVSPFVGFTFNKPSDSGVTNAPVGSTNATSSTSQQLNTFTFAKTSTAMSPMSFTSTTQSTQPARMSVFNPPTSGDSTSIVNTTSRPALRRPHAPAPASLASTPTVGEMILYEQRANLLYYAKERQWKDKGPVQLKIVQDIKTKKVHLIAYKQDMSKIICSHHITPDVKFMFKAGSNTTIMYTVQDPAKDIGSENFAVTFDLPEQASQFYNTILNNPQKQLKDRTSTDSIKNVAPTAPKEFGNQGKAIDMTQKPLSELFKPAAGSWECKGCYTRNDASKAVCAACSSPSPSAATAKPTKPLSELFKPPAGSWECKGCYTRNDASNAVCAACTSPSPSAATAKPTKPLSELFKPPAGSWECKGCYTRNDASKAVCAACTSPSPSAATAKPTKPLSELFKPPAGSWECKGCYTRNDASKAVCAACKSPSPSAASANLTKAAAVPKQVLLSELYKPAPGSWECKECYTRNDASKTACAACKAPSPSAGAPQPADIPTNQVPPTELSKLVDGSWKCKGCQLVNAGVNNYCVGCDVPKDPSMPPKPKQSSFNLGTSTSGSTATFSFGIPKATGKDAGTGFNFSISKSDEKATNDTVALSTPAIFGSSAKSKESTTGFVFEFPQRPTTPPNKDSTFTFGSPGKGFDFRLKSKTPVKSPGAADNSEEEVAESEDVYFAPVIPLPEKVDVKTGEEDENILYSHRAKLFRFDPSSKEWKERGLGDIKLLEHKQTGKLRLIMRRDQVLKLCLNHLVAPELELKRKDEKTLLWNAADYSEGEIEYMQFACRFKTAEIAEEFKRAVENALKGDSARSSETSTSCSITESPHDIQVVYELKVTPEEKAEALKLQLPENFYAYKQKEDCPGCLGCREPSPQLFGNESSRKSIPTSKSHLFTEGKSSLFGSQVPFPASAATSLESTSANAITCSVKPSTTSESMNLFSTPPSAPVFGTGFGASKPPASLNSNSITTSTIFGGMSFGEKKPPTAGFVFGGIVNQNNANNVTTPTIFGQPSKSTTTTTEGGFPENLKICSPFSTNSQTLQSSQAIMSTPEKKDSGVPTIFGGSPASKGDGSSILRTAKLVIGNATDTAADIPTTNSLSSSTPSTFTFNAAPKAPLFAANTIPTSNAEVLTAKTSTSLFGNFASTSTFDNAETQANANTTPSFSTLAKSTEDGTTGTAGFPSKFAFGTSVFGNSAATSNRNIFGGKVTDNSTKTESEVSFLPTNTLASFSTLAAKANEQEAFKKADPNFSFAGAGSCVFGSKSSVSNTKGSVESARSRKSETAKKEDDGEDDHEENDNDQEHDPFFEPIVPLPDMIEVRTGEEEEEKIFCHRAKLYRYDNATKEWKERGVGDMKLLYHADLGSYRLLLRRELVHKVVCNFLLTPDIEFHTLMSSDRSWIWAGMNYAEEPTLEKLAVKFKSPELAQQFKDAIDKAQNALREKQDSQGEKYMGHISDGEDKVEDDEDVEKQGDEDDEEDEDGEDDDDDNSVIFEKRASLYAKMNANDKWTPVALGNLVIYYDSDLFEYKIELKADESGKIVTNTVISMDTVMQVEGKECVWAGTDYALEPPLRRILKAVFSSTQAAQEMYKNYEDGLECAKHAGTSDPEYYGTAPNED